MTWLLVKTLYLLVSAHDGLQNGWEWSHSDSSGNQDGMFSTEDVAGRCAIWPVNENLHHKYVYCKYLYFAIEEWFTLLLGPQLAAICKFGITFSSIFFGLFAISFPSYPMSTATSSWVFFVKACKESLLTLLAFFPFLWWHGNNLKKNSHRPFKKDTHTCMDILFL